MTHTSGGNVTSFVLLNMLLVIQVQHFYLKYIFLFTISMFIFETRKKIVKLPLSFKKYIRPTFDNVESICATLEAGAEISVGLFCSGLIYVTAGISAGALSEMV